jgi:hypothetical protein
VASLQSGVAFSLAIPLTFVSPRVVSAIADDTVTADLAVSGLAKTLPRSWIAESAATRNA